MRKNPLLTVEDHFLIEGRGLVVVPLLDLPPEDRRFIPFDDNIRIKRPDGTEQMFSAEFTAEHAHRSQGRSGWHITVMIPEGTKKTIPIGSGLFVTHESHARIRGEVHNSNLERMRNNAQLKQ